MRARMRQAASVGDYRALARARLPHFLFEYLDGGSYDEVTLRRNVGDLQAVALKQRVLRDVSAITLSTLSACSIGEVARAAPLWFQLYIVKDRDFVRDMIAAAKESGCGALLL